MAWVSLDNLTRFYTKLKEKMYLKTEVDTKLNGKANTSHTHDDRYYTESEINTKLNGKANTSHTHDYAASSHNHDGRYYTESEIDTKISTLNSNITSNSGLKTYAIDTSRILANRLEWPGSLRQSMSYTATEDCYFILFDARSNSGNGVSFVLTFDGVTFWDRQFDNSIGRPFSCFLKAGQNISISCGYHLHYMVFGLK